jgi:predicted nucleic acid-binding protein
MRIFLDANIIFSAVKSEGAIHDFIHELIDLGHLLVADPFTSEEARRNVALKFPERLDAMNRLLRGIELAERPSSPGDLDPSIKLVEKDRPVLASAIRLRCNILLTGDSTHFGHLYGISIQGVTPMSPRMLAEFIDSPPVQVPAFISRE